MSVRIQFDGNQDFQQDAISAVTSLFRDWSPSLNPTEVDERFGNQEDSLLTESFFSNPWGIDDETLLQNVMEIQGRTRIDRVGNTRPVIPDDLKLDYSNPGTLRDFSIEMETGTGKTYVYLRTAIELFVNHNISKFVIVVPTIAIREGVLASLRLMKAHFENLYPEAPYDSYVYESRNASRLRQFATSSRLQILVMNIQAFNTEDRIINTVGERGYKPVEFITAVRPVVIMDEPQKLDAAKQKKAIANLNPLFRLRYSATHKDKHCLLFRLSPVDAYDLRLVKQISVLTLAADDDGCSPYVEVVKITPTSQGVSATLLVNLPHQSRVRKQVFRNSVLSEITNSNIYQGWEVEDIYAPHDGAEGYVEFRNGRKLRLDENNETDRDWWQKAQIQATIEAHLAKELELQNRAALGEIAPTKPLTLIFVDRVANYFPKDGKFRVWFEELYQQVSADRRFRNLKLVESSVPVNEVHAGYFSVSGKGEAKDTSGETADDRDAYDKIMRKKEELLSFEEPIRFIFSHTALQEGWDNPNVFTICNLQEGVRSETTRRQQLGRGLRLPVMGNGQRCRLDDVNVLTIVASETFESFASNLQSDFEKETGETFGASRIKDARKRRPLKLRQEQLLTPEFHELWKRISPRTHYKLQFTTEDIVSEAELRLRQLIQAEPVIAGKITKTLDRVVIKKDEGVGRASGSISRELKSLKQASGVDLLSELSRRLPLSRSTIYKIIKESGTEASIVQNPNAYMDRLFRACNHALGHTLKDKDGIRYYPVGESWDAEMFLRQSIPQSFEDNLVPTTKSIFDAIPCDSNVEREFAGKLEADPEVRLFLKLPSWFKVPTPLGNYNPDWAVVKQEGLDLYLYLIRETKGTDNPDELFRDAEKWKVSFGNKHFSAIDVDYEVVKNWR